MDKSEGNGSLFSVAEAIGDGRPVDWEREGAAHPGLRGRLARLKVLEAVAVAHRATPVLPPAQPPAPSPPASWGHLRILERLGGGGFAEVYRAFDTALEREVALKLPRHEVEKAGRGRFSVVSFLEEARKHARVKHPNVLVIHGADFHEGRAGIWTDLLEGKTLEECLTSVGPFSEREAANIGIELCRALAAVHAAGMLHRDVKTSNVMREVGGRIVLMDFGCVGEATPVGAGTARQTSGTPAFMAPEVLLDGQPASVASDIYSLGAMLYRLVSGRDPVSAGALSDHFEKLRRGEVTPLLDARSDLSPAFARVVEKALAHDPSQRYASAGMLERALAAAEPVPPPPRPRRIYAVMTALAMTPLAALLWIVWPSASFSVEAALYRQGNQVEERLLQDSHVALGDLIFLEMRGSTPLHVYVLNEDQAGSVWAIFPAGLDLANPLREGATHRLPGRVNGEQQFWKLSTAGGRETLLVVASRTPLDYLEREVAGLPKPGVDRAPAYAQVSQEAAHRLLRGIGEISGRVAESGIPHPRRLSEIARSLPSEGRTDEGIWWWQIHLTAGP
ncbi:MAG: serine/threonine-protein kinase [Candidatus Polarisedimenticolia bacterium]